jgi:hypothetical protein
VMLSADDYDAETAERYGWINRALPAVAQREFVRSLAHRIAGFPAGCHTVLKDRVNEISLARVDDVRRDSDLFLDCARDPESQRRTRVAMTRGFQTHDGEIALTTLLGDLAGAKCRLQLVWNWRDHTPLNSRGRRAWRILTTRATNSANLRVPCCVGHARQRPDDRPSPLCWTGTVAGKATWPPDRPANSHALQHLHTYEMPCWCGVSSNRCRNRPCIGDREAGSHQARPSAARAGSCSTGRKGGTDPEMVQVGCRATV